MNKLFLIALIFLSCVSRAEVVSVDVFDGNFQHLLKTKSEPKISQFNRMWATKKESKVKIKVNWGLGYKLDLAGSSEKGRWLYYGGWVMPLSAKASSGLYKIESYKKFEALFDQTHNK